MWHKHWGPLVPLTLGYLACFLLGKMKTLRVSPVTEQTAQSGLCRARYCRGPLGWGRAVALRSGLYPEEQMGGDGRMASVHGSHMWGKQVLLL